MVPEHSVAPARPAAVSPQMESSSEALLTQNGRDSMVLTGVIFSSFSIVFHHFLLFFIIFHHFLSFFHHFPLFFRWVVENLNETFMFEDGEPELVADVTPV